MNEKLVKILNEAIEIKDATEKNNFLKKSLAAVLPELSKSDLDEFYADVIESLEKNIKDLKKE